MENSADYVGVTPRMNKKGVKSAHELPNKEILCSFN